MKNRIIQFSPPDITEREINAVVETLKSGWITTGPKTKLFEKEIAKYCGVDKAVALNSATAAMELVLRLFEIGPGDEVITSAYTYTASASVILHCGAKLVLVDTKEGDFNLDPQKLENAITERTKAIIPVDIGGMPADIDEIYEIIERKKHLYVPKKGTYQEKLGRILILTDAAHSLGAEYNKKKVGSISDYTTFSFHAVKNLTTAEGGAIVWKNNDNFCNEEIYSKLMLLALHGQTKDALAKLKPGAWRYDIVLPGYKYNMTDINAAIGLEQLKRYENEILVKKRKLITWYEDNLKLIPEIIKPVFTLSNKSSSMHLYMIRIKGIGEIKRDFIIEKLAERGISTNVHFQPLPLLLAYKNFGFDIKDYPNSYRMYENEISLPLHCQLTKEDIIYICNVLKEVIEECKK